MKEKRIQITRRVVFVFWFILEALCSNAAHADILCKWFGHCMYESPGFQIRVIDKETGKPLADVHALAEWVQYGYHGRTPLLVAQDALSDSNGLVSFQAWAPKSGSSSGLVLNQDPVISLYKRGYDLLTINNAPGTDERASVRGLKQNGKTFAMVLFRGTADARLNQLLMPGCGYATPGDKSTKILFREPYLNRFRRLSLERSTLPEQYQKLGQFFWQLDREISSFEETSQ